MLFASGIKLSNAIARSVFRDMLILSRLPVSFSTRVLDKINLMTTFIEYETIFDHGGFRNFICCYKIFLLCLDPRYMPVTPVDRNFPSSFQLSIAPHHLLPLWLDSILQSLTNNAKSRICFLPYKIIEILVGLTGQRSDQGPISEKA